MAELFADLIGHTRAVQLLDAALRSGRLAPAYLFAGPSGVGRRKAAYLFLEGVLAGTAGSPPVRRRLARGNHPDLLLVEPTYLHQGELVPASKAEEAGVPRRVAPSLRLEQVREISRFLGRRPVEASLNMVLIEAAEAMAEASANALLKTLEEPGCGMLILITASPQRLLATIRSRAQLIPFGRLTSDQMACVLAARGEAAASGSGAVCDPPELIQLAAGSPGALLEQRHYWQGLPEGLAERLLHANADPMEALSLARDISEALDGEQQIWVLNWLQLALWRRRGRVAEVRRLERLRDQLRAHVQPRLAWEVALLEILMGSSPTACS